MNYKTLQDVPIGKLRKWLALVEKQFGFQCGTARTYRAEIRRRKNAANGRKGVRHGK